MTATLLRFQSPGVRSGGCRWEVDKNAGSPLSPAPASCPAPSKLCLEPPGNLEQSPSSSPSEPQIRRGRGQTTSFTCSGFSEEKLPLALTRSVGAGSKLAAAPRAPALSVGWIRSRRFAAGTESGTESGTVQVEPRFPPAASFNRAPPRLCLTPHGRAAGEERGHTTRLLRCAPPSLQDRGVGRVPFCGAGSRGPFPVGPGEQS